MARGNHPGRGGKRGGDRGGQRGRGFSQNGRGRGRGGYNPIDDLDFTVHDYDESTCSSSLMTVTWCDNLSQMPLEVVVADSIALADVDAGVVVDTQHHEEGFLAHFVVEIIRPEVASTISAVDLIALEGAVEAGSPSTNLSKITMWVWVEEARPGAQQDLIVEEWETIGNRV